MQAVTFSEFGGPEVLRVVDRAPIQPRAGEVVVDVLATGISPTDIMMRNGEHAKMMTDLAPPFIAGMDFAGHIAEVGEGVELKVGQPVIGLVNPRRPDGGSQSQQVRVPAALVAPIDARIDLLAAATVPMNAATAMLALELLDLSPGQKLLVTGGAGILGGFTIQLAAKAGLTVLTTGRDADRDLLQGFGAHVVLPRDAGLEEALRSACPAGVDGMLDGALIGQRLSHLVREGGTAVAVRGTHAIADPRLRTFVVSVGKLVQETADMSKADRMLRQIAGYVEDGTLTPRPASDSVFNHVDAAKAYDMAEQGVTRGRVLMRFR